MSDDNINAVFEITDDFYSFYAENLPPFFFFINLMKIFFLNLLGFLLMIVPSVNTEGFTSFPVT